MVSMILALLCPGDTAREAAQVTEATEIGQAGMRSRAPPIDSVPPQWSLKTERW